MIVIVDDYQVGFATTSSRKLLRDFTVIDSVDIIVEGKCTSGGDFEVDINYETTVGISEDNSTLTLFPNPAKESVTIQGKNNSSVR